MKYNILIFLITLLTPFSIYSQIVISGDISGELQDTTYYVDGDLTVTGPLTIPAGATFRFAEGVQFRINSNLFAYGEEGDSIIFLPDIEGESWGGLDFPGVNRHSRLHYCKISGSNSSGIYVFDRSSVEINHCLVENNSASTGIGAGLHWDNIWPDTLYQSTFRNNQGHGIWVACVGTFEINDCEFSENEGVGAYLSGDSGFNLNGCESRSNQGYGVFAESYNVYLEDCLIDQNNDSGVKAGNGGHISLLNCEITNNSAFNGGGVNGETEDGRVSVFRSLLVNNYASNLGGAGYEAILVNCTIINNTAEVHGAVCASSSFINCIATNNHGPSGIYGQTISSQILSHSLCYENGDVELYSEDGDLGVYGTLMQTNLNGDSCDYRNNLFMDPLLTDIENEDYTLTSLSPCIDAGEIRGDIDIPIEEDPDGTMPDMGAFWYSTSDVPFVEEIIPEELSFDIFPNPTNGSVNISLDNFINNSELSVSLYDLLGRQVQFSVIPIRMSAKTISYSLDSLPSGTYFMSVTIDQKNHVKRVVLLK